MENESVGPNAQQTPIPAETTGLDMHAFKKIALWLLVFSLAVVAVWLLVAISIGGFGYVGSSIRSAITDAYAVFGGASIGGVLVILLSGLISAFSNHHRGEEKMPKALNNLVWTAINTVTVYSILVAFHLCFTTPIKVHFDALQREDVIVKPRYFKIVVKQNAPIWVVWADVRNFGEKMSLGVSDIIMTDSNGICATGQIVVLPVDPFIITERKQPLITVRSSDGLGFKLTKQLEKNDMVSGHVLVRFPTLGGDDNKNAEAAKISGVLELRVSDVRGKIYSGKMGFKSESDDYTLLPPGVRP